MLINYIMQTYISTEDFHATGRGGLVRFIADMELSEVKVAPRKECAQTIG